MAMLYHKTTPRDILYVDAMRTVISNIAWLKRILYYAALVRSPFGKTPPVPVCEYISSNHDQFSIRHFFSTLHEKEYHVYGEKNKSTSDFERC